MYSYICIHVCGTYSICEIYIYISTLCRTTSYHIILYHTMYDIDHDHHCPRFYVHHCSYSLSYSLSSCPSISSYIMHDTIFYSTVYIHVCMLVYRYAHTTHDGWDAFIVHGVCSCVCRALLCIFISVCSCIVDMLCIVCLCACMIVYMCDDIMSCSMYVYVWMVVYVPHGKYTAVTEGNCRVQVAIGHPFKSLSWTCYVLLQVVCRICQFMHHVLMSHHPHTHAHTPQTTMLTSCATTPDVLFICGNMTSHISRHDWMYVGSHPHVVYIILFLVSPCVIYVVFCIIPCIYTHPCSYVCMIRHGVCSCVCHALSCMDCISMLWSCRVVVLYVIGSCVLCVSLWYCHVMYICIYVGMYTRPSTQGFDVALSCWSWNNNPLARHVVCLHFLIYICIYLFM